MSKPLLAGLRPLLLTLRTVLVRRSWVCSRLRTWMRAEVLARLCVRGTRATLLARPTRSTLLNWATLRTEPALLSGAARSTWPL